MTLTCRLDLPVEGVGGFMLFFCLLCLSINLEYKISIAKSTEYEDALIIQFIYKYFKVVFTFGDE